MEGERFVHHSFCWNPHTKCSVLQRGDSICLQGWPWRVVSDERVLLMGRGVHSRASVFFFELSLANSTKSIQEHTQSQRPSTPITCQKRSLF